MSAWLPAGRRAEAFAAALSSEAVDERFDDLLEVVGALRHVATVEPVMPRSDYTADLRSRLMAAAETDLVPTDAKLLLPQRTTTSGGRRRGRLSAAAAALVVVTGTAGIAAASGSAVPGDSLYPFKRGVEAARSAVAFSDASRGRDKLDQADARLAEIEQLVAGEGDRSRLPATVQAFNDQAGEGSDLLFGDFEDRGDSESIESVRDFAGNAMGRITDLLADAPGRLQTPLAEAAALLSDVDQQASVLCSTCGARDVLEVPANLRVPVAADSLGTLLNPVPVTTDDAKPKSAGDKPKTDGKGGSGSGGSSGDDGGGTGSGGAGVGGIVGGVVGGITGGGSGGSGSGGSGSTGGSGGSGGTTVDNPIGGILGNLPTATPSSGLLDGVGGAVGGLLGSGDKTQ